MQQSRYGASWKPLTNAIKDFFQNESWLNTSIAILFTFQNESWSNANIAILFLMKNTKDSLRESSSSCCSWEPFKQVEQSWLASATVLQSKVLYSALIHTHFAIKTLVLQSKHFLPFKPFFGLKTLFGSPKSSTAPLLTQFSQFFLQSNPPF